MKQEIIVINDKKKRNIFNSAFSSVIMLLVGILLIAKPGSLIKMVSIILGLFLIVSAVILSVDYFKDKDRTGKNKLNVMFAIVSAIGGIVLLTIPSIIARVLITVIAVFIILSSIFKIKDALILKDMNFPKWHVNLIMAISTLIIGIMFVVFSFEVAETIAQLFGVFLVIYALIDLVNNISIKSKSRNIK